MKRKDQSGSSMVEFALVLPLLMILLLGIMEFGLVLYDKAIITNASREGARAGILAVDSRTEAKVKAAANKAASDYLLNNLVTFHAGDLQIEPVLSGSAPYKNSDTLTVKVKYKYGWLALPGFLLGLPSPLELSATSQMRFE
jgi:Flp pilus assembly protein TadG